MEHEADIPWTLGVVLDKVLVARRPLLLRVAGQHTLQADADALDVVDGAPALAVEEVETYDAVGVDVWVPGDWVGVVADEDDFGSFCN
jgi:hypothetical protein